MQAAILAGDAATGVSIMKMDAGMDTGPVYTMRKTEIGEEDDSASLGARLAQIGAEALVETLYFLEGEGREAIPQDSSLATYCPKITREDARVDWTRPAAELVRRSRAFAPWPGLFTLRRNARLKLSNLSHVDGGRGCAREQEDLPRARSSKPGPASSSRAARARWRSQRCRPRDAGRLPRADFVRGERVAPGETWGDDRPRSAREIALGILLRVDKGAHAAPLLDARGRELDGRDRDFLRALVKKTLRGAIRLDHVLERHLSQPAASLDPPVLAALRLGAAQLLLMDRVPAHAAVGETVAALRAFAPKAAGLVNAVLRRVAAQEKRPGPVHASPRRGPGRRLALETSHPGWLVRAGSRRSASRPRAPPSRRTTSTRRRTFSRIRAPGRPTKSSRRSPRTASRRRAPRGLLSRSR